MRDDRRAPFADTFGVDPRILDEIDDAVSIGDPDRRFVYWNAAAERMFGYPFEDVRGKRFEDIVEFEVVAPGGGSGAITSTAAGQAWRGDSILRRRDGSTIRIETTASPIVRDGVLLGRISINRDVTDVRNKADTLAAIFAASPLGVVVFDQDRHILLWSRAAEQLFGWTAAEVVGTVARMVPPADLGAGQRIWDQMTAGEVGPHDVTRLQRDGTPIEVRLWGAPLRDSHDVAIGMVMFVEDLRERRSLEAQLVQSQKLESIGRLAGGVAHDFNNLLTAIGGYAEMLQADLARDEPHLAAVDGIVQASEQAAALTRQLLAFSRNQPLRPAVVDLRDVVDAVLPLLRRLIGERIHVVTHHVPDLWPTLADRSQLEAVLVNLAVNARDAMPNGGTITIETANVELDETYAHTHAEVVPGPFAMVAISDTGTGMDAATASRIFEPFFTTKAVGRGTGLGLATVYGTVRQSGGHIWVYSERGQGTTFKIYLPKTSDDAQPDGPQPTISAPDAASGARILLVEDEVIVRDMVVAALERRGYRVMAVESAEAAIELLGRAEARVDLMLTDVVMPGLDGPELLQRAWILRPRLPAVFMSGYTALTIERRPIPDGVRVLEKPFTAAELDRVIREALSAPAAPEGRGGRGGRELS